MNDDDFDDPDLDEPRSQAIEALLAQCARWLLEDADRDRFVQRLAQEGPVRFPALLDAERAIESGAGLQRGAGEQAVLEQRFFRSFGLAIWAATPLPVNRFKPPKLVLPGRNQACVCGSLLKFKQCCKPLFDHLPPMDHNLLGGLVITALPPAQWKALQGLGATPAMVMAAADLLQGDDRLADALRVLEPWAKLPAPWPAAHAELLDLLADLYLEADKPRKRKQLAQAMIDHGGPEVQSMGWQRLAMIAADAGDADGADAAFERAQRLTPDAPRLALLEVTLLLGTGRFDRATQRADFHIRRLGRMPPSDEGVHTLQALQALLETELDADDDDDGDGDELAVDPVSSLGRLLATIERLPPPRLRLRLEGASAQDLGALRPDAATAKALKRWREVFPLSTVGMAHSGVSGDWDRVFEPGERWSRCFIDQPVLADSFEALDGVITVLESVPMMLAAHPMAVLTQRALALWTLLRERFPQALCEWGHLDNRPALRLIVRRIMADQSLRADEGFEWLQAMVQVLNPNDNHGLRERLAAVYLRRGRAADALALCERYPDDFAGMQLLHARALLALQRLPEARQRLQAALKANAHLGPLLQSRRKPRLPAIDSYAIGSREEALLAMSNQHDLWGGDKAVQPWLAQCLPPPAGADAAPAASLPLFPDEGETGVTRID